MALLEEELNQNTTEAEDVKLEAETEQVVLEQEQEEAKNTKSSKKTNKKPSKVKGAFSELKKVTWPTFGSVVKKTAVVLSVTLVFLVVIIGIDQLLYLLYNLLTKNM
ncbi:MAG: preprotein translocase subunit SecE [Clostridia bacterium]|nr:preprotein translocase subunit SecE [Clostridia bacterium]